MTHYELGGILIVFLGVVTLLVSLPTLHLMPRHLAIATQVGSSLFAWLTRALAIILFILGMVTLIQQW